MHESTPKKSPERIQSWKVIEAANTPRNERERGSEDGLLEGPECYGVLDGVSSGNGNGTIDGLTAGQFAVRVGIQALKDAALRAKNVTDIVPFVTQRLRDAAKEKGYSTPPSFVFAAYFPRFKTVIRVGDCTYKVDDNLYPGKMLFDEIKADAHARIIKNHLKAGMSVEEIKALNPTKEPLRQVTKIIQPALANATTEGIFSKLSYLVMDGKDVPDDRIEYEHVPHAQTIQFWTDGYLPGSHRESVSKSDEALREMLRKDPLAIKGARSTRLPNPKFVDDRAAITIRRI